MTGASTSPWVQEPDLPYFNRLQTDLTVDVCIVGGGISGLTTAYLLSDSGLSVAVVQRGRLTDGETARTSAHLSCVMDDGFAEIERLHGEDGLRIAYESHREAINRIESIVREESIDCEFERVDGYLFLATDQKLSVLERELEAAHRAGCTEATLMPNLPGHAFYTGGCIGFPHQAQLHPLKYLAGLARVCALKGVQIFHDSPVEKVDERRQMVHLHNGSQVHADDIVVATNSPVNVLASTHLKQSAWQTYVVAGLIPRGSLMKALYWDTEDPYHYVRIHPHNDTFDMLIVGGEDHRTGQKDDADDRYDRLLAWTKARFPLQEVVARWSGEVMEPIDGLAFIGQIRSKHHIYIATGDSGMGLTHGTIAGMILSDLIQGRPNPWSRLYDPWRMPLKAAGEMVREGVKMAIQYGEWLTPGDVASESDIAPGSGAVIRHGLRKLAVYRDENGELHRMSAICAHLGAVVRWNSAEKTWDCPAHGSRYDCFGHCLHGPATRDLTPEKSD